MKFKDMMSESVEIDHSKYEASHGKKAKSSGGIGYWFFEVNGKKYQVNGKTLREAANKAVVAAKAAGEKHVSRVFVLP